ncbi:hypothetical protein COC52_24860 [Priestia megaterium]|uniref:hypothetical protein n=1 Tax=Priestia megaterium TaxID=1404 RepID=UPI000BFCE596|nr:hypothetical protein [Priestia megaterium]PGR23028.1 hypothetical protein COC52_24860 [Priestia megaterium]
MKPIQLWLPLLNVSWDTPSFSRDIERAQKNWIGEDRIWLLPGLKEVKRWSSQVNIFTFKECAIPSESFNVINVIDVTKQRTMYPPGGSTIPENWQGKLPENLLNLWLSSSEFAFISTENSFKMKLPFFTDTAVTYKEMELCFPPGPSVPISKLDEKERKAVLKWPPEEIKLIDSVSPEAESSEFFGKYMWEKEPTDNDLNIVVNKDGRKAFHAKLLWNEPFGEMFPLGGGIDLLNNRSYLKSCVKNTEKNIGNIALQANRFTSVGWTNLENQMVAPALLNEGLKALLFEIEGRFNIEVNSFKELLKHEKYNDIFHTRITVTRVFGWEGYFWWELNNLVNVEKQSIKTCILCGGLISGKKDKIYCGKKENPDCFRKRRASDKRKEREK